MTENKTMPQHDLKKTLHQTRSKTKHCTKHDRKQNNAPTWPKTKQCIKHELKQNTALNTTYTQSNEPCSLVTDDALTQCYYLLHHILITGFKSSGMRQCVAWQAVPRVFKDHSSLIFGALQSFEMSQTTRIISQGNIAENLRLQHHHHHHSWTSNLKV